MRTPRLGSTLLIILLPFLLPNALARSVPLTNTCHDCQVYLSLIAYHPQIMLLAPPGGVAISSLAPILAWRPPVAGIYRVQVSEDSAFAPTSSFALSETKDVKA